MDESEAAVIAIAVDHDADMSQALRVLASTIKHQVATPQVVRIFDDHPAVLQLTYHGTRQVIAKMGENELHKT